jgi:hypothetical protein
MHRVEPDHLAVVVGEQRALLRDLLLRREEEVARRRFADLPQPLEDGRLQVGAAVEVLVRRRRLVLAVRPAAGQDDDGRRGDEESREVAAAQAGIMAAPRPPGRRSRPGATSPRQPS